MKRIFATIALWLAAAASVAAQVPNFPQTLPENSVVGRLGIGPGPAQAIPFGVLQSQLGQKVQFFSTLAAAQSARILGADIVQTLGRNTAGDNGGASYVRISASTAAAWRFRSVDGQWWALNNQAVTPEMFGAVCDGVADTTSAVASISTWLRTAAQGSSSVLNFTPGSTCKIWSQSLGSANPIHPLDLTSVNGLTINFNGAKFTTDNLFTGGDARVFFFDHTQNVIINDAWYVQTGKTTLDGVNNGGLSIGQAGSAPWTRNIVWNNIKQFGGSRGVTLIGGLLSTGLPNDNDVANITINNADFDTVYYPMSFAWSGDNVTATNVFCHNCGRVYFPYNVSNHRIELITDGGGPFDDMNLKVYVSPLMSPNRNVLANIDVKYKRFGRSSASTSQSMLSLAFQHSYLSPTVSAIASADAGASTLLTVSSTSEMATGQTWAINGVVGATQLNGSPQIITVTDSTHVKVPIAYVANYVSGGYMRVPAKMRDVHIHYDVDTTTTQNPAALLTYKVTQSGADTGINNYVMENVTLDGVLAGYNYGIPAINAFNNGAGFADSLGTWTGETVRNIIFRDLEIRGTNSSVVLDATAIDPFVVENVSSGTGVPWTITGCVNNCKRQNVSVTGLTDQITATPIAAVAGVFLTGLGANGVFTTGAPAILCAGMPALTGDVTTSAGSCATAIGANKVLDTMLRQSGALAVVGRSANSTGNVADIQATAGAGGVFRESGSTVGFGTINLVTAGGATILPAANGGSGQSSYAIGDMLYASTTSALSKLADVATGNALISGGVGVAPAWGKIGISTHVSGLGTGIATALGVNTGSAGAPVLFNGALGTPSSGTLTSATGLPISTGLTGAGTGVLAALGTNVGSAGAPVLFNGALGTPSSATLTSATGLPLTTGVAGVLPIANGGTNSSTGAFVSMVDTVYNTASSSTGFTFGTGCLKMLVRACGGGGGGGSGAGSVGSIFGGGGGGSGSYSESVIACSNQTVTLGVAGAGGTSGADDATAGGDASFGALVIGKGGARGRLGSVAVVPNGGVGGVAGTGTITAVGTGGGGGVYFTAGTGFLPSSGFGGSSSFGGGAPGIGASSGAVAAGLTAGSYCSGGSGGIAHNIAANTTGGSGSAPLVIVREFRSQ